MLVQLELCETITKPRESVAHLMTKKDLASSSGPDS